MKYLHTGVILLIVLFVSACASSPMKINKERKLTEPSEGQSKIVFIRDSYTGRNVQASLYETTSDNPEFIGLIPNGTKVPYEVEPGNHTFMVVSEAADFMQATMKEGKTYYAMVLPRMGFWRARFSFKPFRGEGEGEYTVSSESFNEWVSETYIAENTPESRKWARNYNEDVVNKYESYWKKWKKKSEEEKEKQTLHAEDGK